MASPVPAVKAPSNQQAISMHLPSLSFSKTTGQEEPKSEDGTPDSAKVQSLKHRLLATFEEARDQGEPRGTKCVIKPDQVSVDQNIAEWTYNNHSLDTGKQLQFAKAQSENVVGFNLAMNEVIVNNQKVCG